MCITYTYTLDRIHVFNYSYIRIYTYIIYTYIYTYITIVEYILYIYANKV